MEFILALITGTLYGAGLYMMLRRSMVKLLIGLTFAGQWRQPAYLFTRSHYKRETTGDSEGESVLTGIYADPVPQALILTAIVISFGLLAFAIILLKRVYRVTNTDDLDNLNLTDDI
jgi:multicomponent Na+:H+ antiporter subunit C